MRVIIPYMFAKFCAGIEATIFAIMISCIFSGSSLVINDHTDQVREFTRPVEFDYFDWTLRAIERKLIQTSIDTPFYFDISDQHKLVLNYLMITDQIIKKESQLDLIYIDPNIKDPEANSKELRQELVSLYNSQEQIAPFAESVLEEQISRIIIDEGLSIEGQPFPPVLFHISPLPYNLIISPRNNIQQQDSISLISNLSIDKQVSMEDQVQKTLNVSALVVPVGGIGSYPTMVERSTSLDWLSNTIAHEWIHNWLSFRPLGQRYDFTNELRTMNETTASIAGDEIGKLVINRYYPELTSIFSGKYLVKFSFSHPDPNDLPVVQFDFRDEMHKTRVEVDRLLAEGKIDEAEKYMENRRKVFWDNGYAIRKLNQAYFAFYGAYADVPGGAAGEDPVGPAVRSLRSESPNLLIFLQKISQMTSFKELKAATSQ
jgi:hypothetical protein